MSNGFKGTIELFKKTLRGVGRFGIGRQGGLVAARRIVPRRAHSTLRKSLALLVGSTLIGTSVAFLAQADLGLSPYDVLVDAIEPRWALSFGQTAIAISSVFFTIAWILGRRAKLWGVAYVVACGLATDAVAGILNRPETLMVRWIYVGCSIVILAIGIALVVHSSSTGGSFELLTMAGIDRGLSRATARTILEISVLTAGIALGGRFGPGTVVVALLTGPTISIVGQILVDHERGRALRKEKDTDVIDRLDAHLKAGQTRQVKIVEPDTGTPTEPQSLRQSLTQSQRASTPPK